MNIYDGKTYISFLSDAILIWPLETLLAISVAATQSVKVILRGASFTSGIDLLISINFLGVSASALRTLVAHCLLFFIFNLNLFFKFIYLIWVLILF